METKKIVADLGCFVIGTFMTIAGVYLFMNQVQVSTDFWGWRYTFFWGRITVTAFGLTLIPFIIGVGMIFFNARSKLGWVIATFSFVSIFVGIIASLRVNFAPTTLYVTLGILILLAGGLGLIARALKPS